jgi:lantibiotic leader peptide-processing serine protease
MLQRPTFVSSAALACALLLLAGCADDALRPLDEDTTVAAGAGMPDIEFEPTGSHIVMFRGNDIPSDFVPRLAALGGTLEAALGPLGIAVVSGLNDESVELLGRVHGVQLVEPDYYIPLESVQAEDIIEVDDTVESLIDPGRAGFFQRQWHHRAIHAHTAWAAGFLGSADVSVAILDTGIDYNHASLAGRVDLARSISLLPSDDAALAVFFPGAHPIADLDRHGSHVASTVVSTGQVVAGVTAYTTLFGVKVCGWDRGCPRAATLEAIMYAADAGADVINMSLGGTLFRSTDRGTWLHLINRATNYAHRKGSLVVVSAGNDGADLDHNRDAFKLYCDAPNVVCVSGTGPTWRAGIDGPWNDWDQFWTGSNFGRSAITVGAPSGNLNNFVYAACSSFSWEKNPGCRASNRFSVGLRGTSMAAPHVSGVAALIAAHDPQSRGNPARIRNRLRQTADRIDGSGNSPFYGAGRVNAARAVGAID